MAEIIRYAYTRKKAIHREQGFHSQEIERAGQNEPALSCSLRSFASYLRSAYSNIVYPNLK